MTPSVPPRPTRSAARRARALATGLACCLALPAWSDSVPPARAADCSAGPQQVLRATPALPAAFGQARAAWLDATTLRWAGVAATPGTRFRLVHAPEGGLEVAAGEPVRGTHGTQRTPGAVMLQPAAAPALAGDEALRVSHIGAGLTLGVAAADAARLREWHRGQLLLVQEDAQGRVQAATRVQAAAALDHLYAAAADAPDLGAVKRGARTHFGLWAPTARAVALCLHEAEGEGEGPAARLVPLRREAATGVWRGAAPTRAGTTYTYLVDVFVPGAGLVRNRVTDPWALALTADSARTAVVDLDDPALQPAGWQADARPNRVAAATDLVIYELHVRDFSLGDDTVPAAHRGTYLGFTHAGSRGMRHLRGLAQAGLTDVHLLPVFDLATVPETGCARPDEAALRALPADSREQQALLEPLRATDCYNWGYDPWHYTVPEGSYATDARNPATRIVEFRRMVQALHAAGLRVGMDVVYNHTTASGQHPKSVLDRIVPGYYHRLNGQGEVERSTCCDNTATEHRMMARLMIDSAVVWARDYRIDSFRFDLMGHQPRAAMVRLQQAVNRATGRHIHLIGEGWNFGEVAGGARFVQAAQGRLDGTGIGTFSDRGRDAVRGGGCCDSGPGQVLQQGWVSGLVTDPNEEVQAAQPPERQALLRAADLVRVALAGTLRDFSFQTHQGAVRAASAIDYAGQGAGYASQPGEVVNYTENHDNQTLFDVLAFKLPRATPREERARVQHLANAVVAFSQGIAYFHAGQELLRSKSMDRNSYDSGDWFNRLDYSYRDNGFAAGLPPRGDNESSWPLMAPRLADARIRVEPAQIEWTHRAFLDLLRIRAGTSMLRLRTAQDVQQRLRFLGTGPQQPGGVVAAHVDGRGLLGAGFAELVYAINVDKVAHTVSEPALAGRGFELHPVLADPQAADARAREAAFDRASGTLTVPPRTAVVWVLK